MGGFSLPSDFTKVDAAKHLFQVSVETLLDCATISLPRRDGLAGIKEVSNQEVVARGFDWEGRGKKIWGVD